MSDNAGTAVLAGGCFWIMQQLLRDRDGITSTRVGWTGGENDHPTEENNATPRRLRSPSIRSGFPIGTYSSSSFRSTGPTLANALSAPATARRSLYERGAAQGGRGDDQGR
jgi:Peptide methionine sulfoxide reductase